MEISAIVPVYNKEKYISRILGDISNQSFEDFECIIVDDGSTDSSGEICDEFAAPMPRIRSATLTPMLPVPRMVNSLSRMDRMGIWARSPVRSAWMKLSAEA